MTVSSPAIRSFRPDDLPAMQKVREAAFRPVFRSFADIVGEAIAALAFARADAEQAQMLNDLCKIDSDNDVLVAAIDGAIVGFLCFSMSTDKRVGEIGLNAVHPDHAGRGIGTRMYELVLARMKERGMALATVGTGGDPSHAPARRAYQKAGSASALPSLTLYKLL